MSKGPLARRLASPLAVLCLLAISATLEAQSKPARTEVGGESPNRYLWVGNSFFYYNNSMHGHVANLARMIRS